jgi:hypothetical protein
VITICGDAVIGRIYEYAILDRPNLIAKIGGVSICALDDGDITNAVKLAKFLRICRDIA